MVHTAPANVMEIHIAPASTHEPVVATTRLATATTDSAITTVALVPRRLFLGTAAKLPMREPPASAAITRPNPVALSPRVIGNTERITPHGAHK